MRKPRRILVGAHKYEIEWVDADMLPGKCIGVCDRHRKVIKIAALLPKRMLLQSLLHELMHAIYYEWGLINSEMSLENYIAGVCSEEDVVNVLSLGLITVLAVNPSLVTFCAKALQ